MKSRRRDRPTAARKQTPPAARRRRHPRWAWLPVALIPVAGLALLDRSDRGVTPTSRHEADRLGGEQALGRASELGRAGLHLEAVPYFRRVADLASNDWRSHYNLASALNNAAQQVRRHLGRDDPAARSTYERATMLREACRQCSLAVELAPTPSDRALLAAYTAQLYSTWGFPLDALDAARAALAIDPGSAMARNLVAVIESKIEGGEASSR